MRTVPCNPPLKRLFCRCSTKPGRSSFSACGVQATALPSGPAMDVNVPHSCTVSTVSAGRSCELPADNAKQSTGTVTNQRRFIALLLRRQLCSSDHGRKSVTLRPKETRRKIARQQSIVLCARNRFLSMLLSVSCWFSNRNECCRKFHLGIVAAPLQSQLNQRVSVKSLCRILLLAQPLLVSLREIACVKDHQRIWLFGAGSGRLCIARSCNKAKDEFFRSCAVFSGVERSSSQRLHVNERDLARIENVNRVRRQL